MSVLQNRTTINQILDVKKRLQESVIYRIKGMDYNMVPHLMRCIVTGGCISSIFHNEKVNDYDMLFVFHRDLDTFMNKIVPTIAAQQHIRDITTNYSDQKPFHTKIPGKCVTDWAVTFKNDLQVILKPVSWREQFDFIHCMPYYDITKDKLYISPAQYQSIVEKQLVINTKRQEPTSTDRIKKYCDKGWLYPQENK